MAFDSCSQNLAHVEVSLPGRDLISFSWQLNEKGQIQKATLVAIGCPELLRLVESWRPFLTGELASLPLPKGSSHAEMLLRECLLKAQGAWLYPYQEAELCHCRAIPTAVVDASILAGAHSVEAASRQTSAGTACGTCRRDIEAVLKYRLA
jgi:bacterioferritin-associated ferredoxin